MYTKILVLLDGSALAEAVLPHVRALAVPARTEIVLLRVPVEPAQDYFALDPLIFRSLHECVEAESKAYVEKVATDLRRDGYKVTPLIECGPVADTILDAAQRLPADLIVMSTHGHSGLTRWLLGSVADRVVHAAQSPVLLVRPARPDSG